ncbi:MAG TPA: GNAT family N-acetyltransferase [Atopostipes sp.]|nr:GNAT family N-acetyltransferase [Atopostipes sp.]
MLIRYNDDFKKIAMGLLSYVPDLKEPSRIEEEIEWYESEDYRQLYLWKSEETGNLIGLVGIEVEELVLLRHISIDPSYRNEGLSFEILDALKDQYPEKTLVSTLETASLISSWQKKTNR